MKSSHAWSHRLALLAVIGLAFGLRLQYLTLFSFHIDEFFTLAAAKFITETGAPIYPTGLFYDPGLPYSYIVAGLFQWTGGFSEAVGRWPAVIFGTLSVVTVYWVGVRVLGARWISLLAALLLTLNPESIEWGGRVRMITLAQWLTLLSVGMLWISIAKNSARHRILFALSYGLTLLTHFSTVVLLPAWFAILALFSWLKLIPVKSALIRDGIIIAFVAGLALSSGVIFQPPPSIEFQTNAGGLDDKFSLLSNKFLQFPSDLGHAWESYGPYFFDQPHRFLSILAFMGIGGSLLQLLLIKTQSHEGRKENESDPTSDSLVPVSSAGAIYLALILIIAIAVLALVINPHWQRSRYLVMQVLGIYYLLGALGLYLLATWIFKLVESLPFMATRMKLAVTALVVIGVAAIVYPFVPRLRDSFEVGYAGWNRYDLAATHIAENKEAEEEVITMHPPASWIYLEQSDFYLVQASPKLIQRPDGQIGDRYTGAQWLADADQLQPILAQPERTWLLVQEFWLFNSYDSYLQQQILQGMDKQWGEGGVWALVSRPNTWPLARSSTTSVEGIFENGAQLVGFDAQPAVLKPGGVMWLTLFWQAEQLPNDLKVFVHLRDEANNTVAQADHIIYDGKVPSSRWPSLFNQDPARLIRDGATLFIPPDLAAGSYRLLVGFYHPETFARVGVVNDVSGEAGVILAEWILK